MCDPKPGARCSADTWKELLAAQKRLERANRLLLRDPRDPGSILAQERASANLDRKQAAYDSSTRGQADLVAAVGWMNGTDPEETDRLRTRLAIGRQTRVDQKRALARSVGKSIDAEYVEVAKALSRLRHPNEIEITEPLHRYDTVGFFAPIASWSERSGTLSDRTPRLVALAAGGSGNDYAGTWSDGLQAKSVATRHFTTAEECRHFASHAGITSFYDAQVAAVVPVAKRDHS